MQFSESVAMQWVFLAICDFLIFHRIEEGRLLGGEADAVPGAFFMLDNNAFS
jgi:hypothetical protein